MKLVQIEEPKVNPGTINSRLHSRQQSSENSERCSIEANSNLNEERSTISHKSRLRRDRSATCAVKIPPTKSVLNRNRLDRSQSPDEEKTKRASFLSPNSTATKRLPRQSTNKPYNPILDSLHHLSPRHNSVINVILSMKKEEEK